MQIGLSIYVKSEILVIIFGDAGKSGFIIARFRIITSIFKAKQPLENIFISRIKVSAFLLFNQC